MRSRVICISHAPGAGGEHVGASVADTLGFRYIDEEIVSRAATALEVPTDLVADVERRKSLMRRVLAELHESGAANVYAFSFPPPASPGVASDDYRALIGQVIAETAEQGNVVIVAHGASQALGERPEVLRVLVTASPATRARRLTEEHGFTSADAAERVKRDDRDRADYFKRFYRLDAELPTHYDLVVNTDALGIEDAARLVLTACDR